MLIEPFIVSVDIKKFSSKKMYSHLSTNPKVKRMSWQSDGRKVKLQK